jgi:cytochrome c-type biogenesis protein CcmH/NrfF
VGETVVVEPPVVEAVVVWQRLSGTIVVGFGIVTIAEKKKVTLG